MQSVHAVQVTWHSGSLPVRREIIRTLWGCEHLKWIQILCSSNATIWGSSGNMQIFLKLQSWLWGWIIIFDSSFLSDITLGKAQCSSAWHAAFQTKASAFCDIICFQENCCLQSVHLSSPHPISSPHYSQIPLKCVMLLIFSPKALVQQLKKKKKVTLVIQFMSSQLNSCIFDYFVSYISNKETSTWPATFYKFQMNTEAMSLVNQRLFMKSLRVRLIVTRGQTITNTAKQSAVALSVGSRENKKPSTDIQLLEYLLN